jgi:hypothetical protein
VVSTRDIRNRFGARRVSGNRSRGPAGGEALRVTGFGGGFEIRLLGGGH